MSVSPGNVGTIFTVSHPEKYVFDRNFNCLRDFTQEYPDPSLPASFEAQSWNAGMSAPEVGKTERSMLGHSPADDMIC